MTDIGTVEITLNDLEDARQTFAACLTFLVARDVMESQASMNNLRQSPLTTEVERLSARFDGYLADYLLQKHQAEQEALDADNGDAVMGGPEPDFEPLSDAPLGQFSPPRQAGRRLTGTDLRQGLVGREADATDGDA